MPQTPAVALPSAPAVMPMLEPAMMSMMLPIPTDAQMLRARYGAPDFIRREMDSELWRYDGQSCAVFVFLYRDGDVLKVRYFETMPRGMGMAADTSCIDSLNAHGASP
jgi:hypothetical protein